VADDPPRKIRSDPATVKRLLADLDARERQRRSPVSTYRTRRYVEGPHANPGWCCQGGLPSLGEGYS
jgi:hypothetical protein